MKTINKIHYIIIAVSLSLFFSCKKDKASDYKMPAQGPAGEVMVVCEKSLLRTAIGDSIISVFNKNYKGLPDIFPEAYFKIDTIPPSLFDGYTRRHRNVFQVRINPKGKNKIIKKNDIFAIDQNYIRVDAKNEKSAAKIIGKYKNKILEYYQKGEIVRHAKIYQKDASPFKDALADNFKIKLSLLGFKLKRNEKDFLWVSKETKHTSQAIMIYNFPFTAKEYSISKESLLSKRDEFLKKYVEGWKKGTYMRTETKQTNVYKKGVTLNGHYAVELRGNWTLEGGIMGGPFLSMAVIDEANSRILMLDSYVFAPKEKDSRVKLLREVEGVFNTLYFLPKERK